MLASKEQRNESQHKHHTKKKEGRKEGSGNQSLQKFPVTLELLHDNMKNEC